MSRFAQAVALLQLAGAGLCQTITAANGASTPATAQNVAPAGAVVPTPANKDGASYFSWETFQLTSGALTNLTRMGLSGMGSFSYSRPNSAQCKAFPGDANWPSEVAWDTLNLLTGGKVIKTVPLAAPCYTGWSEYNATLCQTITNDWSDPHLHANDPTSTQWPLFEGLTCAPPSMRNESTSCTLGGYASYSVEASTVADIQLALNFASNNNIRLVVKNTGHDFADKSVGAGSLSIWTHNLNDIQFFRNYKYGSYNGPAFKIGTGAWTQSIYEAADANNVTVVGGECRTVALGGGYIAGGGHSPMSSLVGMAADQVFSMEVVLPDGSFVTASANSNPDIFWALRGGGGSTYGVVTSVVIKAYPQVPVTTMTFSYATGTNLTVDTFWESIGVFMSYFPAFPDAGTYAYFSILPNFTGGYSFTFDPFWGLNKTTAQVQTLVGPYLQDLKNLGINVAPVYTSYPSLLPAWNASFPPEQVGGWNNHAASRLFPRENFVNATKLNATLAAVRYAVENNGILIGYNIKMAENPSVNQNNSANPAWRETVTHFILASIWDNSATFPQIAAASEVLTNDWMAQWRAASPGAGSYMSEGDINEPDFQQSFFGSNYAQLYALKQQYDPTGLFYAPQAVGSEDWYITDQIPYLPTQNGRLCRNTTKT